MNSKTKAIIIAITIVFSMAITVQVLGASFDTSTGSFTLNSAPEVTDVDFNTDAYAQASALTPDETTYMRLNFTVTTSAGISDILNATIYVFDDSTHGANYDSAAPDGIFLTRFLWVEATDTWTVDSQGSMTNWAIDNTNSNDPGTASGLTTYEFSMRFLISKVARYDTDWNATVHVFDDDGTPETDSSAELGLVTMSANFDVAFSTGTFTWGSDVQPSSTNNTHDALTITVYANADWELKIEAIDFSASAESDVDVEANDIICWDQDGSVNGISQWIRNTVAILPVGSTWDAQSPMTDESGLARNVYIFLSPALLFVVGKEWSTTVTVTVQANT